jgi:hypothetical protein
MEVDHSNKHCSENNVEFPKQQQVGHQKKFYYVHRHYQCHLKYGSESRLDTAKNPDHDEYFTNTNRFREDRRMINVENAGNNLLMSRNEIEDLTEETIDKPHQSNDNRNDRMGFEKVHQRKIQHEIRMSESSISVLLGKRRQLSVFFIHVVGEEHQRR